MPGDDEAVAPVGGTEVGGDHLGIFVQIAVAGGQHGAAQGAVLVHDGVAHLVLGGITRVALVQGVDRDGGAVGQHGGLQGLDAAVGAVVEGGGSAPAAGFIIIDAVQDGIPGGEAQKLIRIAAVHAAPEHHGPVVAIGGHRGGQVRRGVGGEALGSPAAACVDRGHDLRAVHQQVLLLHGHLVALVLFRQPLAHADPGRRGKAAAAGDVHVAVAVACKAGGIGDGGGVGVAAAAQLAEVGAAVVDAGIGVFSVVVSVADVDQNLAVAAELRIGAGVGVGLETAEDAGIIQGEQGDPGLGLAPGAGVGLQIVQALEGGGGGGHLQAAPGRHELGALEG